MEWWVLGIILFAGMLFLLFLGINIPFGLGFVAIIGIFLVWDNPVLGLMVIANEAYHRGTSFLMMAVPMFVLMAEIIMVAGFNRDAYDALSRFLCRLPGGLAVATTVLSALFAALTGSSVANAAITGRVAIEEMERHGYNNGLAGGVVVAGGVLGILIPPSIPMIFYALFSEESVNALFISGIVPAILGVTLMVIYIVTFAKLRPALVPPLPACSLKEAVKTSYKVIPLVLLIFFMIVAFYFGIASPTEIGGVAAFMALLITIVYRRLNSWEKFKLGLQAAVKTVIMLMWILVGALAFGTVLAYGGIAENLVDWVAGLPLSPFMILVGINIFLIVLGCVLETGAIMMVVWPLLIGIAESLGFNLIWFAVILVIQMEVAQITPPVGIVLFAMKGIAPNISVGDLYRGVLPFVGILILVVVLVIAFPQIALWLPSTMR
ncbi:TRAP transporter large permease [Chloroflexota bacterium]